MVLLITTHLDFSQYANCEPTIFVRCTSDLCRKKYIQIVKQIFAIVKYSRDGSGSPRDYTGGEKGAKFAPSVGGGLLGGAGQRIFYSGNHKNSSKTSIHL
jgi:hypothetical protein